MIVHLQEIEKHINCTKNKPKEGSKFEDFALDPTTTLVKRVLNDDLTIDLQINDMQITHFIINDWEMASDILLSERKEGNKVQFMTESINSKLLEPTKIKIKLDNKSQIKLK